MASLYTPCLSIEKPAQNDYPTGWSAMQDANHDRIDAGHGQVYTLALGPHAIGTVNLVPYSGPSSASTANAHFHIYQLIGALDGDVHIIFPQGVGGRRYFDTHGVAFNNHAIYVRAYEEQAAVTYGCRFTAAYYLPAPVMVWPGLRCMWDYGASPPGTIIDYAAWGVVPHGWLIADGHIESTAVLDILFHILGYGWGGSGTFFALPDLRGRAAVGADDMRGVNQGNYTGLGPTGRFFNYGVGPTGNPGQTSITLATGNLPSHLHSIPDPGHTHSAVDIGHAHNVSVLPNANPGAPAPIPGGTGAQVSTTTGHANISVAASLTGITQTGATGSGTAFQTVQPSQTVYKLIRA